MRVLDTDAGRRLRLADDDRGRVPFALVGVLLLVGSVTWTVALSHRGPPQVDADAGAAIDRGESVVRTELRQAVARAGATAARDPVVERANTPFGQALGSDAPYRDALRIRAYLQAAAALDGIDASVGDVEVGAGLPPITNASTMRDALDRVQIVERDAGVVRVRFENVSLAARSNGRTIEQTERSVTVTVATPALSLHERAGRFEGQLERDALDGAGFERRLAARLYAMTWARGYAQYGGAPIADVLANRHVELSANAALLQTQRATIGVSDPAGRAAMGRATARVGAKDLLDGAGYDGKRWVNAVLGEHPSPVDDGGPIAEAIDDGESSAARSEETTVAVNRSADVALYRLSAGRGGDSLDEVVDDVYETDVRRIVETELVADGERVDPPSPGENWTSVRTSVELDEVDVSDGGGTAPSAPYGWDEYAAHSRDVERTFVAETRWVHPNGSSRTTTGRWSDRHRVGIAVVGDPAGSEYATEGSIKRLYEPGGPAGGPNFDGVPEEAVRRLVGSEGGPDAVARAAVVEELGDDRTTIERSPPSGVENWIYRDLVDLREETRNVSVSVERGRLATGVNPAADLESRVQSHLDEEQSARRSYASVADKARVAARIAYLERLAGELDDAANSVEATRSGIDDELRSSGAAVSDRLGSMLSLRDNVEAADPRSTDAAPPADKLRLSVDGTPAYLTLASVSRSEVSSLPPGTAYYPLTAETTNVFTVPSASNAGGVVDHVLGSPETVGIRQGARVLAAADGVESVIGTAPNDGALGDSRSKLREEIVHSNERLREVALNAVREETSLDRGEREAVVDRAVARWRDPGDRALALVDGPAANAVANVAAEREGTPSTSKFRDELRSRLLVELSAAAERESVQLPDGVVGTAITETKRQAKLMVKNATDRAAQRVRGRIVNRSAEIPTGIPVTPVPGYWYATANVWDVELAGEYESFRIDARQGTPAGRGAVDGTTSYVRDGTNVTVDVTGDGDPERLGRSTHVSFRADVSVLVVVPPGKSGVGDVDGDRTERSGGWPDPGFDGDGGGSDQKDGQSDEPYDSVVEEASDNA